MFSFWFVLWGVSVLRVAEFFHLFGFCWFVACIFLNFSYAGITQEPLDLGFLFPQSTVPADFPAYPHVALVPSTALHRLPVICKGVAEIVCCSGCSTASDQGEPKQAEVVRLPQAIWLWSLAIIPFLPTFFWISPDLLLQVFALHGTCLSCQCLLMLVTEGWVSSVFVLA